MILSKKKSILLYFIVLFLLSSCAIPPKNNNKDNSLAYLGYYYGQTVVRHYLPVFIIENKNEVYNLIGTPEARTTENSKEEIFISTKTPTIYSDIRRFKTPRSCYTNLIYRIHFEKVPFSLFPFHLGWGKNVGIIVVVTLNQNSEPILYTTVATCGCYLAFTPTSFMPQDAFPDDWNNTRQSIYGESLPGLLDFKGLTINQNNIEVIVLIRSGTHRVKDIFVSTATFLDDYETKKAFIQPLSSLQNLPLGNMGSTSFYEGVGSREGYVKFSSKPWERLLMSWWVLNWHIGQDKKYGIDKNDSPVFFTSLKPWARDESDMRDFFVFLSYWGWKL